MIRSLKLPVLLFACIFAILLILKEFSVITPISFYSYLYACIIAFLNHIAFNILLDFSFKKSNQIFLIVNLGGMGLRVLFMLILVFIAIKFLKIDEFKFIFAFFLLYVLFMVYEIIMIRKKLAEQGKAPVDAENVV